MAEYLITARNPAGAKSTEQVEADSADLAVETLKARGWTDVVLHNDDVGARYSNQAKMDRIVSPKDYISLRNSGGGIRAMLVLVGMIYLKSWLSFTLMTAVLIYRRWKGDPWSFWDAAIVAYLLMPIFLVVAAWMTGKSRRYRRLIDASSWGRWDEVLAMIPRMRGAGKADDLVFHHAKALAGLGRFDEAMAILEPFSDGERMPEWLYRSRLPEVYFAGGYRLELVGLFEAAREVAPENPSILIELGDSVLRYRRDPKRAKALLDEARTHAPSEVAKPFPIALEAKIALAEGRPAEAKGLLEQSYASLAKFRHLTPMIEELLDLTHGELALAYAAMGEPDVAAEHFRKAEPRLRALGMIDRIEECERAIGGFAR